MENELGKPSPAYLRELKEVAEAASALSLHLVKANILPRDFPVEPVSTLCAALVLLPHGTSEGSVPVLIHARERVPALRREYVLSEPEEGEKREHHDTPPVFRGEELDRRLNELYAAVGTALDHYKAETRTEIEPDAERDAPVLARPEFGLDETVKGIRKAEAEIDGFKNTLPENSASQRRLSDIDSQLKTGRSEASMPAPKPALLTRIGKALRQTPEALETIGYLMSAADDFSEPLIDAAFEILRKKVSGFFGRISRVGTALEETGRRMKKWRDGAPGGNGTPPSDFDLYEVHAMIRRGERPPEAWRPFIRGLRFPGEQKLRDLSALSDLGELKVLNLENTQVSDLSAVASLGALEWLFLNDTLVSDLSAVAGLSALESLHLGNTQVSDLSAVAGLEALNILSLSNTQVSDLSAVSGLSALSSLFLNNTKVSDLSPVSGLSGQEQLSLDDTQVIDLAPLSGLKNLSWLSLDGSGASLTISSTATSGENVGLKFSQEIDLRPLSELTNLKFLSLNNMLGTIDLSSLSGLYELDELRLEDTEVQDISTLDHLQHLTIVGGPAPREGKPRLK